MKDEPFFEFGTKENNSKLSDKTVGSANQSWEFHQLYEKKTTLSGIRTWTHHLSLRPICFLSGHIKWKQHSQ
jgi:hypothetical protein